MLSFATVFLASIVGSSLGAAVNNTGLVDTLRDAATAVDRVNACPRIRSSYLTFSTPLLESPPVRAARSSSRTSHRSLPLSATVQQWRSESSSRVFNVNGTIRTGMITENGGRFIMTDLQPGQMTIFPQGSIHFQINEGCEPALFVSGLNSEDPGALQIAQRFFGLPPDIVAATLGDIGIEEVMGLNDLIPDSVALGTDECLQRCGITRTSQPTTQQQTRVSGNAFPSGVTASTYATGYQSAPTTSSKSH
ncbi:RmlC-like cupin [Mycena sanguinolenta]|uniref:RmlC-like cupin n=1 Tax=Mycena sanguinolenta TaxID=230812 RepID=A0A8H6XCR3_9AGAR|nr:RmlC-like cupin [Mycena sanguinolenta]